MIVVSFAQEPMEMFGDPVTGAPHIFRAPSEDDLTQYFFTSEGTIRSTPTPPPSRFLPPWDWSRRPRSC